MNKFVQLPPNHRIHGNSNSKWNIIIFNMTLMTVLGLVSVWEEMGSREKRSLSDGGEGIEEGKEDFRADFRKCVVCICSVVAGLQGPSVSALLEQSAALLGL